MPHRNRVTPFGTLEALAGRGLLTGNRGVLHNAARQIVRESHTRRWIACRLEFRGRHREIMPPGRWTALFFLDDAAALAAGHRPCAECRHADYTRFVTLWRAVDADQIWNADAIDRRLHAERRLPDGGKRTFQAALSSLPPGTFVAHDDQAWLVRPTHLRLWTAGGYTSRRPHPAVAEVSVLTPPSLVALLRAGYSPALHPSAMD